MAERAYFPQRVSVHVPDMQYATDVAFNGETEFSVGTPAALSVNGVLNAAPITNAASVVTAGLPASAGCTDTAAPYGRAISVKGGTAGDNAVITVRGRDYLNQPMAESFPLNGVTGVNGKKAFRYVDQVSVPAGNANASSTISIGTLDIFGLPYRARALPVSLQDGVTATAHTFVPAAAVNPQTGTSGDPRGTFTPASASNGSRSFGGMAMCDRTNLHGFAHYYA